MSLDLTGAALACFGAGAVLAIGINRFDLFRQLSAAAAAVGCLLAVIAGAFLVGGERLTFALPVSTPLGQFEVAGTALGGLFLLVIGLVGIGVALYSADYVLFVGGPPRQGLLLALFNLALASVTLIVVAANAVTFLIAWEAMSLLTYVLVAIAQDHEAPTAAFLMLALNELGFVAIAVGFAAIGALQPGHDFASLSASALPNRDSAFLLFLFGFGAKAGLVPLQGWLPEAYPAAPSNVSALLSSVVVKMAVYGLILSAVVLLGTPPLWWGYLALAVGVVTAIYGVLFSLLAYDLKRALAFSSVENLGFMVALVGAALLFRGFGKPLLEGLALAAAGLHVLNHSLLKATLFLGAGSVQVATGLRDMDRLGGLWKRMRWTSLCFFIGAAGLAGVPPLNGFQSEWLGLQVLLQSHLLADPEARIALAGAGALVALTLGLAVTTFVRMIGGAFLGAPRVAAAERAVEVPPLMRSGTGLLAGFNLVLAVLPPIGVGIAASAAAEVSGQPGLLDAILPPVFLHPERFPLLVTLGGTFLSQLPVNGLVIVPADASFSSIAPTYILAVLAGVILVTALVMRLFGVGPRREATVWVGGAEAYRASMQYTASGFTNPLRFIFGGIYQSRRVVQASHRHGLYFLESGTYVHSFVEPIETYLYRPVVELTRQVSQRLAWMQSGSVSLYLLYLFLVFLVALFVR